MASVAVEHKAVSAWAQFDFSFLFIQSGTGAVSVHGGSSLLS